MSDHPYPAAVNRWPSLRQSLLSSFDNCALTTRFEAEYRKGWDTHYQGRGTLFHRLAAKCLEEMARQGESRIEVDVTLGILHEVLRQEDVDKTCHEPGCERLARFIPVAERQPDGRALLCDDGHRHHSSVVTVPASMIADLYWIAVKWSSSNEFDVSHLVSVEERLDVSVYYPNPDGGFVERVLTGQLDALFLDPEDDRHAIVLDWKDTWALPPQTELSFEGYFQQRFYALLVMRNYKNIEKVTLREFYVRFSEPREVTIERGKLDEIEAEFTALAERFDRTVETDNWKPTPGKHCNFCSRPTACPIPVFTRGEGRIIDPEQAQKVAAQLLVAQVVVDQTQKALRAYSEVNGDIPVKNAKGDSYFGFEEYERVTRPTPEKAEAAQRNGIPVTSLYRRAKATRFKLLTRKPKTAEQQDDEIMAALEASLAQAKKRVDG